MLVCQPTLRNLSSGGVVVSGFKVIVQRSNLLPTHDPEACRGIYFSSLMIMGEAESYFDLK